MPPAAVAGSTGDYEDDIAAAAADPHYLLLPHRYNFPLAAKRLPRRQPFVVVAVADGGSDVNRAGIEDTHDVTIEGIRVAQTTQLHIGQRGR